MFDKVNQFFRIVQAEKKSKYNSKNYSWMLLCNLTYLLLEANIGSNPAHNTAKIALATSSLNSLQ